VANVPHETILMTEAPPNARLEALSDGVFAIALTLLILDVRLPEAAAITSTAALWRALQGLGPSVFAFVLSFGIILITWVNHRPSSPGQRDMALAIWNAGQAASSS
jgi:uncharacterized membrane protein